MECSAAAEMFGCLFRMPALCSFMRMGRLRPVSPMYVKSQSLHSSLYTGPGFLVSSVASFSRLCRAHFQVRGLWIVLMPSSDSMWAIAWLVPSTKGMDAVMGLVLCSVSSVVVGSCRFGRGKLRLMNAVG